MNITYDVDYFISKFQAIPEEGYCIGELDDTYGAHCANGWCGVTYEALHNANFNEETKALQKIFSILELTKTYDPVCLKAENTWEEWGYSIKAADINNGETKEYQQPTPKQRILAALYDIKAQQQALTECKALVKISHYQYDIL